MKYLSKSLRSFPSDAVIVTFAVLGVLSWTNRVDLFRLEIAQHYEHMLAYGLVGLVMLASTARYQLNLIEITMVVVWAASSESLKVLVPFRHPKTSDYFADMFGFMVALTFVYAAFLCIRIIASIAKRLREAIILIF